MKRLRVLVIQRVLPHYRAPFFDRLREALDARGIELTLAYGQEQEGTVPRTIPFSRPWAVRIENSYWKIGGHPFVWQPCLLRALEAELVIVEQANALLLNHLLVFLRGCRAVRIALWGHGRNFQARPGIQSISESLKSRLARTADWWFAYTEMSRSALVQSGCDASRITVVHNTIDAGEFKKALAAVSDEDLLKLRSALGIQESDRVGLYCGGLYSGKNVDWLIHSSRMIRSRYPGFHLLIIGDGPEEGRIRAASEGCSWIHILGPKFGADRAPFFRLGHLFLMPRLVGLALIDAFAAGLPTITTAAEGHGPEIAYLRHEENGLVTHQDMQAYVDGVLSLLNSEEAWVKMRAQCEVSSGQYSLEAFVENFANGVAACIHALNP